MAAIPQRTLRPWAATVIEWRTFRPSTPNHVFAITRDFLDDTARASAAGQGDVYARVKIGTLRYTLASLSAESPFTELLEPFVLDQEFTLYVSGAPRSDELVVQFEGYQECDEDEAGEEAEVLSFFRKLEALISWDHDDSSDEEDEDTGESATISEDDDDSSDEEDEDSDESASISEDDDDSSDEEDDDSDESASSSDDDDDSSDEEDEYSSDDEDNDESASSSDDDDDSDAEDDEYSTEEEDDEEEEESHGEVHSAGVGVMLQRRNFVPNGQFGAVPAQQFASAGSTAGFMRVAALESQEKGKNCNKQIISVLYRCTHFSVSGGGMRVRESTPVYQLRFAVPPAAGGNTARTLQVVGTSLAPHVYPVRYRQRLQRLWSSLLAEVSVPTRVEHVEVLADFGILRTVDRTPKRMERMRAALEDMVGKDFDPELHLEFQLPEPAQCGAGEDCAVCFELLEGDDLAAWPGCSKLHVFHGACLELILKTSDRCPLCRNVWCIEPKCPNPVNTRKENDGEVDRQAPVLSSAGRNAKRVRQAVAKACLVLFHLFVGYRSSGS